MMFLITPYEMRKQSQYIVSEKVAKTETARKAAELVEVKKQGEAEVEAESTKVKTVEERSIAKRKNKNGQNT